MIDIHDIEEKITSEIYKKIRELKTELFESSGTTLGRNWDDLTPKYKKWKQKIRGSAYPINIFTGYLLQSLIDNAIKVNASYDENLDNLSFKIDLDTDRIGLDYANYVNDKREYISLSEQEKKFLDDLVVGIVEDYLEGGL